MLKADIYKKFDGKIIRVNFDLEEGEILVIMGENGVGKSTVLNMISGLVEPDDGEIIYKREIFFSSNKKINKKINERNIGYITQENILYNHLNIYENIILGVEVKFKNILLTKYLKEYNLGDLLNKYP